MPMLINHAEYMNNCEVGRRFGGYRRKYRKVEAMKGENDKCQLHPNTFQWTEVRTLTRTRTRNY